MSAAYSHMVSEGVEERLFPDMTTTGPLSYIRSRPEQRLLPVNPEERLLPINLLKNI